MSSVPVVEEDTLTRPSLTDGVTSELDHIFSPPKYNKFEHYPVTKEDFAVEALALSLPPYSLSGPAVCSSIKRRYPEHVNNPDFARPIFFNYKRIITHDKGSLFPTYEISNQPDTRHHRMQAFWSKTGTAAAAAGNMEGKSMEELVTQIFLGVGPPYELSLFEPLLPL